jgi:hypothetical protein
MYPPARRAPLTGLPPRVPRARLTHDGRSRGPAATSSFFACRSRPPPAALARTHAQHASRAEPDCAAGPGSHPKRPARPDETRLRLGAAPRFAKQAEREPAKQSNLPTYLACVINCMGCLTNAEWTDRTHLSYLYLTVQDMHVCRLLLKYICATRPLPAAPPAAPPATPPAARPAARHCRAPSAALSHLTRVCRPRPPTPALRPRRSEG